MITAYPLTWPAGWPRTAWAERGRSKFSTMSVRRDGDRSWKVPTYLSVAQGTDRVMRELATMRIGREDVVLSTNLKLRLDGLPRSDQAAPQDPGVAVYWTLQKTVAPRCMAIDVYDSVAGNLGAIAATLEAMRAIERHGGAVVMERAFAGFAALPQPGATSRTWRDALNLDPRENDLERARANYRLLRSANHPDKGGHPDQFDEIEKAWAAAQAELQRR